LVDWRGGSELCPDGYLTWVVASRSPVDLDVFSFENLLAELDTLHHGPADIVSTYSMYVGLSGGEASIFEFMDYNAVAPSQSPNHTPM
jgi:hypothetical protein